MSKRLTIKAFCAKNKVSKVALADALGTTRQNLNGRAKSDKYVIDYNKDSEVVKMIKLKQGEITLHEGKLELSA